MPYKARIPSDSPPEWRIQLSEGNSHRHVEMALARFRREPIPTFKGTGCVMAAGGRAYLRMAFITISRIRSAGWKWPIQVWHLGSKELPSGLRERFRDLDVQFVDAEHVRRRHPARRLGGWELKSFMLAQSPFRYCLLLDADSLPAQDPMPLFESPEFVEVGAILAPDIKPCRPSDFIFNALGFLKPDNYVECESGQMMIDKTRHWRAIQLIRWLNDFSEFYYRYVHGDKSSFDLSFLRTKHSFRMLPPCSWEGWGIQQYWFDGSIFTQHRLDRKRNPKAPVCLEDAHYGRMFDEWGLQSAIARP